MKRKTLLCAALAAVMLMSGCGKTDDTDSEKSVEKKPAAAAADKAEETTADEDDIDTDEVTSEEEDTTDGEDTVAAGSIAYSELENVIASVLDGDLDSSDSILKVLEEHHFVFKPGEDVKSEEDSSLSLLFEELAEPVEISDVQGLSLHFISVVDPMPEYDGIVGDPYLSVTFSVADGTSAEKYEAYENYYTYLNDNGYEYTDGTDISECLEYIEENKSASEGEAEDIKLSSELNNETFSSINVNALENQITVTYTKR